MSAQEIISSFFTLIKANFWPTLIDWWWLFLVVEVFWMLDIAKFLWYHWRKDLFDARDNEPRVLLEIKIPEEVLEPIKAMEVVLTGFWQIYQPPNWYEKWWNGQDPFAFTLEIAAIDGVPHFYVRVPRKVQNVMETHIYSQYPTAEISEAEDYMKNVPQDIPNAEWDMWGTGYRSLRHQAYPIRTYIEFETGKEEEEKRIDPIASLLEGMARLKPGEQLWFQIRCLPLLNEIPFKQEGQKLRDELARREKKETKFKPMIQEAAEMLFTGKVPEPPQKEEESFVPVEMKLTPVEKEIVSAVERKIGKLWFLCNIEYIYLGKRDVFFKPNSRLAMSYMTNFATENMQSLVPSSRTITKVTKHWYDWFWFIKRRLYVRKRRLFRAVVSRAWVNYPNTEVDDSAETAFNVNKVDAIRFILTADEIASIYHFPGKIVAAAPTMPRVEAKKAEPPPQLPVE